MKNTFYSIFFICSLGCLCFISGCKKDNSWQEGYNHTDAIHNALEQTVLLVNGYGGVTAGGKDTMFFSSDTIKIKAGSTYLNTYFVCTRNCPPVPYYSIAPPGVMKMIIGSKEKTDTACGFLVSKNPVKTYDCTAAPKNYFNESNWKETKDNKGNIIRREYTIDQADLEEVR